MNQKDLENKGWDAMFQTLEREMPVEKKQRGLLWLWLLVGAVALGGSAWYVKAKMGTPKMDKTVLQPIVAQQTPYNNVKKTSRSPHNFPRVFNSWKVNTSKDVVVENETPPVSVGEINPDSLHNFPRVENSWKVNTSKNNVVEKINTDADSSTLSVKQIIANNQINFTLLESLDILKIDPLSINTDSSLKIDIKPSILTQISTKKPNNKLVWGITTGIHSQYLNALDGFQAGLVVSKPLKKQWDLTAGLSFRQTQIVSKNQADFSYSRLDFSGSSISLPKVETINLEKLYYLEMPLTLNWQFKKHFSLTTGFKTAYLLSQSTSVENSTTAVYWVGTSTNSSYGLSYDKQSGDIKPSAFGLKRWDWALIGGLNYEPTRHIQLGLRYDLGLPKIFNRPNTTIRNRFVGLNVTYLF